MNQPAHQHPEHEQPVVPRTLDGIAAALPAAERMELYREVGTADLGEVEAVLGGWWAKAMLHATPGESDRLYQAAQSGTLPLTSLSDIIADRQAQGLPGRPLT